jgi:hypothetical protein
MADFEFFDYDPLTGVREDIAFEDGKIHIRQTQDVQPILDFAKKIQNAGLADEQWKKHDAAVYAFLPAVVLGAMAKKGIRFLDPNHVGAVLNEINTNYPWLKTTTKTHTAK